MHELALSRSLVRIVEHAAQSRPVADIAVEVGALRQVVPESLRHCWTLVVAGTPLAAARLTITGRPAVIDCPACATSTTLTDTFDLTCPACHAPGRVISGDEFRVTSIDVDADAPAPQRRT